MRFICGAVINIKYAYFTEGCFQYNSSFKISLGKLQFSYFLLKLARKDADYLSLYFLNLTTTFTLLKQCNISFYYNENLINFTNVY